MKSWRAVIHGNQVMIFSFLACGLSWSSIPLTNGGIIPYGPAMAAFIVLALAGDRRGFAHLWRLSTWWRVPWWWYLAAPGLIIAIFGGAFVLNLWLGATIIGFEHLLPATLASTLGQLLLFGGQWEEPGWSGYLLPHWLNHTGRGLLAGSLAAVLMTGTLRVLWHLPLVLSGAVPWTDALLYGYALQCLIAWLFWRTGGSVPVIMLCHLASNVCFGLFMPLFAPVDQSRYVWLFIALAWLAVLVVFRHRGIGRHLSVEEWAGDIAASR
jgi:uncharacterized protein